MGWPAIRAGGPYADYRADRIGQVLAARGALEAVQFQPEDPEVQERPQ
jgi:hypothetical protein